MAGKELSSFISPFISEQLSGFKDYCGSEAIEFQCGFFHVVAMRVGRRWGCGIWAERFRHQELTPVLLFNEVYSLGDRGKALNLKTSLSKWGGRRTSNQRMCQVHALLIFTAKLQISGCGKRKETPFVYVKHQVCRVGKWEWRAGWRIFFYVFGPLFPWAVSAVMKLLQEVEWVCPPFWGISSAWHNVQGKKKKASL